MSATLSLPFGKAGDAGAFVWPKTFAPEASISPAPTAAVVPMNSRRVTSRRVAEGVAGFTIF
jgi:hypothetical protein